MDSPEQKPKTLADYSPGISTEQWVELLGDRDVFLRESLIVVKCLKDCGGEATCKWLSVTYGRSPVFYNTNSSRLGERIHKKTRCPVPEGEMSRNAKWWPVLYTGRYADKDGEGRYSWKLRPELSEALSRVDLSDVPLYEKSHDPNPEDLAPADPKPADPKPSGPKPLDFGLRHPSALERNRIVFGAPGTGKSHRLDKDAKALLGNLSGKNLERVTFHADYAYSHFVGCCRPLATTEGGVRYGFVPGPFLRVLVKALLSGMRDEEPQPHVLVIEEINRARPAAVFGDVFQLLDRGGDGCSEYDIAVSEDVREYLAGKLGCPPAECARIRIPGNMFIWATMNSADQGVFPMDTAFRRRWSFEYLPTDPKDAPDAILPPMGEGGAETRWEAVRRAINDRLSGLRINEDKLIGPYFLRPDVFDKDGDGRIKDVEAFKKAFKSKVLMYLFEDAGRQRRQEIFLGCKDKDCHRYSALCGEFDRKGFDIFGKGFPRGAS